MKLIITSIFPLGFVGSNVTVKPDEKKAPDSSYRADSVTWMGGAGSTQTLKKSVFLGAAGEYTLSAILRSPGNSRFGSEDVLKVGDVKWNLSKLNSSPDRWIQAEFSFVADGESPEIPDLESDGGITVNSVLAESVTLSVDGVEADALTGALLSFDNIDSKYQISSNTASSSGSIVVSLVENTLIADGVTTESLAFIEPPSDRETWIEFYCESTATLDFGGIQVEKGGFSTSMIFQEGPKQIRFQSSFKFQPKDNPISSQSLSSFGWLFHLKSWKGEGNILDSGNFSVSIDSTGHLAVACGSSSLVSRSPLPGANVKFFVSVSPDAGSLLLYIDGVFDGSTTLTGFTVESGKWLDFSSLGSREIYSIACIGESLSQLPQSVGDLATGEVANLFSEDLLPSNVISDRDTSFTLKSLVLPPPQYHLYLKRSRDYQGISFLLPMPLIFRLGIQLLQFAKESELPGR